MSLTMHRPMEARRIVAATLLFLTSNAAMAGAPEQASPLSQVSTSRPFDVIVTGGRIIDGSGAPARIAEIGVIDGRIAFVGERPQGARAFRILDASGLIVAPGFIDPHTHSDRDARSSDPARRLLANHLLQGVTTIVIGNDGGGDPDVGTIYRRLGERRPGPNIAAFVGFGAVRRAVLGASSRAPDNGEQARMGDLVARAMCDGALGLSAGLYYAPQSFAKTAEVSALARIAGRYGGIYDTHLRDEGSASIGLLPAIDEAVLIARQGRLPLHIAHIKALGADAHGMAPQVIARIRAAQKSGVFVTADQYPWEASSTSLAAALVPRRAQDGGRAAMVARLEAADAALRRDMAEQLRIRGGAHAILLVSGARPGKRLDAIAAEWKVQPIDAAIRLLVAEPDARIVSFNMIASDIEAFARQPWVVGSSDATNGHPRAYGSFARRWRLFVREKALMSEAEFVHRVSGRTARILGLADRGTLEAGKAADIVILDPERYRERSSYAAPRQHATGVSYVLINGRIAVENGRTTGVLAGRALPKPRQESWSCPE